MTRILAVICGSLICMSAGAADVPAGRCAAGALPRKISPLMNELLRAAEKPPFVSDICGSWRQRILGPGARVAAQSNAPAGMTVWTATFVPGALQCDGRPTCVVPAIKDVPIRIVRAEPRVNGAELQLLPQEARRLLQNESVRYLVPSCTLAQPRDQQPQFAEFAFRAPRPALPEQGCERGDSLSWGLSDACIPSPRQLPAWKGKTVAILDSGLDCMHDDIQSRITDSEEIPPGRRCPLNAGINFAYQSYWYQSTQHKRVPPDNCDNTYPAKCQGHGTGVAGIVASTHPRLPGVDPYAQLVSMRILGNDSNLQLVEWESVESAILEAGLRAQIINISANWYEDHPNVAAAIDQVTANGALVVVSARAQEKGPTYPAVYAECNPAVIAVGDIMNNWQWAGVYYWGLSTDSDAAYLVAPGNEILTSYSNGSSEKAHEFYYGSSFAAPHVSGAASLVWSMDEFKGCSAQGIREVLWCSARETTILPTADKRKRLHLGCLFGQKDSPMCGRARQCVDEVKQNHCK